MSWSIDECVSIYGGARNVTVQWCLISESLYQSAHAKGITASAASGADKTLRGITTCSPIIPAAIRAFLGKIERPAYRSAEQRDLQLGLQQLYGGNGDVRVNLINNFFKPGPATREGVRARLPTLHRAHSPNNWWIAGNLVLARPKSVPTIGSGCVHRATAR